MKVLVTGGAGFIGSTICSALADAGHAPVILDSLYTGCRAFARDFAFYEGDIADEALLDRIAAEHSDIAVCIHCAARIIVPESVAEPFEYYMENVAKSAVLFHKLPQMGIKNVVFSSSASIYGATDGDSVDESAPIRASSPYARTKAIMEMVLEDYCAAYGLKALALRYFNPIGADPAMRTGNQIRNPSHVLGKMISVATGRDPEFTLTGDQWPTRDGSGLRDYIHVWDLAQAHVAAAERFQDIFAARPSGFLAMNLGTGTGVTVFELLRAFENVFGGKLNTRIAPAREGDVAGACANPALANQLLGWKTKLSVEQGIADALHWIDVRDDVMGPE